MRIEQRIILQSTDAASPASMAAAFRAIGNPTLSGSDYAPFRAIQSGTFSLNEVERAVRTIHACAEALTANAEHERPFQQEEDNRQWRAGVKSTAQMARQLADAFLRDVRAVIKAHGDGSVPEATPAELLRQEYNVHGYHPRFTPDNWRCDVMAGSLLGYWEWAYEQQEKCRG